ncbi:MAG: hypothetical protein AB7I38_11660 [Dehalococcoidia bacterium]
MLVQSGRLREGLDLGPRHPGAELVVAGVRRPAVVSRNRLVRLAAPPRANAMGAGGFTEVTGYGRWRLPAQAYVRDVARFDREIGCLEWAAPQDWMCEPKAFVATGMTIAEHQARTVESVAELRERWPRHSDDTCPIMPVLQGLGSRRLHHVRRAVPPVGDQRTSLENHAVREQAAQRRDHPSARVVGPTSDAVGLAPISIRPLTWRLLGAAPPKVLTR